MKELIYKTRGVLQKRGKIVSVIQDSEDQECTTRVRKNFVYVLAAEETDENVSCVPQIKIKKSFDTKTRDERFAFKIKGFFYVIQNRRQYRVNFCHSLKIHLKWKSKVFSPKKSVSMA